MTAREGRVSRSIYDFSERHEGERWMEVTVLEACNYIINPLRYITSCSAKPAMLQHHYIPTCAMTVE